MKKLILALLALTLCATHATAMGPDKQLHFGMSVPFGVLGAHLVYEYHPALTRQHPAVKILGGALIGTLPGLGKEFYDRSTTGFDWADVQYDFLGALVGSLLYAGGRKVYLSLSPQRVSVGMQW